jgi:molecular chaperone DnaK
MRQPVDEALADLKAAIKPEANTSVEDLTAKVDKLNQESQKMGAALYAATSAADSAETPGADSGASSDNASGASDDDVVDAEVVEDDEEKK